MKYRLMYTNGRLPDSDLTEDVKTLLDYVASRPKEIQGMHVEDECGGVIIRSGWALPNGHFTAIHMLKDDGTVVRLTGVFNASGKWVLVEADEAWRYNGNDNDGVMIFGEPPEEEQFADLLKPEPNTVECYDGGRTFLITKSESEYLERHEEFEQAADTADRLETLNSRLPNDVTPGSFLDADGNLADVYIEAEEEPMYITFTIKEWNRHLDAIGAAVREKTND